MLLFFYLDIAVGTNTTDCFPNSSQRFVTKFLWYFTIPLLL